MRSNVYLSKSFLKYMVENKSLLNQQDNFELSQETLNYQKVKNIISKSNLLLEYKREEIKDIIHSSDGGLEAIWLKSIIKSELDKDFNKTADYSNSYTIFLEDDINCIDQSTNNNILIKGINYNFIKNFFKDPLRSVFKKNMSSEDNSNTFHLCKNIILIDPYIFVDHFKKSKNLINFFMDCFGFNNISINKHITIISSFPTSGKDLVKNKKIENYRKDIAETLNMKIENVTILRLLNDEFKGNRHLITDYALMDLQHIFDRDDGVVSGLYLYNNRIDKNFIQVNKIIDRIKTLNSDYKEKHEDAASSDLKHNRFKFGDIMVNPLLN